MKAALSPPSDGLFEVDGGEVQSKVIAISMLGSFIV